MESTSFYKDKFVAVFEVNQELKCWDEFMYSMSVEEYNDSWESDSVGCATSQWFDSKEEAEEFGNNFNK